MLTWIRGVLLKSVEGMGLAIVFLAIPSLSLDFLAGTVHEQTSTACGNAREEL